MNDDISSLETSFQDGCKTIADKITALGVTTSATASPTTICNNIQTLYDNASNLNSYVKIGDGAGTYDISQYTSKFTDYTIDDFVFTTNTKVGSASGYNGQSYAWNSNVKLTTSYNASTGTLTVTDKSWHFRNSNDYGTFWCTGTVTCTGIYLLK